MSKKKVPASTDKLLQDLLAIHIPASYTDYFDLYEVKDNASCYELVLHEKEHLIPEALALKSAVVLDGFCDSISILSHSFSLKKIYLIVKRRRWKEPSSKEHYSNSYNFLHKEGVKITNPFALFFKRGHRKFSC